MNESAEELQTTDVLACGGVAAMLGEAIRKGNHARMVFSSSTLCG
jgi:hypothetical protein